MPIAGVPDPNIDAAVGAVTAAARTAIEDLVADLTQQNADLTLQITALQDKHTAELALLEAAVQALQAQIDADQGETPTGA